MSISNSVSNGSEWELSKENIQPLKQGRKVANLSAAFGESNNEYQSRLHQEIQAYETAIRTYEGDDPLEVWYRYFVWLSENFPTGGKDQHVLLERCISVFKDEERYKNDERYLKIWLRYADLTSDALMVFDYMYSQGICDRLANFYEYWAYVFERLGNMKKADELYNLGKARNAEPLERLEYLHRAFEIRLAENVSQNQEEPCNENEKQRTALGGLKAHGRKGTVGVKRTGNATLSTKVGGICQPLKSNNTNGFTIFNEEAGDNSSVGPAMADWKEPPRKTTATKENTQKPAKWTESKLSQRHQRSSIPVNDVGVKQPFTVHEDEEAITKPPCTPQHHHALDQVLSSRKPNKDTANDLLKSITNANKDEGKFKVIYCKDKIYAGAREFSFEQLRAARMMAKIADGRTWSSLYPQAKPANTQFKVMYPKNKVYPFDDSERPYDEILLKRYYARKEKRRKHLQTVVLARSCPASPMEVNQSQNVSQMMEKMDISGCHKPEETTQLTRTVTQQHATLSDVQPKTSFQVYDDTQGQCNNQSARRGLHFQVQQQQELSNQKMIHQDPKPSNQMMIYQDPNSTNQTSINQEPKLSNQIMVYQDPKLTNENMVYEDPKPTNHNMIDEDPLLPSTATNYPFSTSSSTSAFNTIHKGLSRQPFTEQPMAVQSEERERLPNNIPEVHQGLQPLSGPLSAPYLNHVGNRGGMSHFGSGTPGGSDNYMASPTVTMNTRVAQDVVMAMFNNPLGMDHDDDLPWMKPHETARDFEAAFKDDKTEQPALITNNIQGFTVFDETDSNGPPAQQENENQENRPPHDYVQEKTNRPITGILQPSHGIPVCPLEDNDDDDDEMGDNENQPPAGFHGNRSDIYSKTVCDVTEDVNTYLANSNFKAAARMASTPYAQGVEPPSFVLSTIKPPKQETHVSSVHDSNDFDANTFACTPNKALSPIFERSDEDVRSVASSGSSTASSGRGSVSQHTSAAIKLESIVEDPRSFAEAHKSFHKVFADEHQTLPDPQMRQEHSHGQKGQVPLDKHQGYHEDPLPRFEDPRTYSDESPEYRTNSEVIRQGLDRVEASGSESLNPFSDEVTYQLLCSISPPVSSYQGYFSCDEHLPNIVEKMAIDLGEDDLYQVRHRIGMGAFAKVYSAFKLSSDLKADDSDRTEVILKVQKTTNDWEFYMCRQLHARIDTMNCPTQMHDLFMNPSRIYNYANCSVLVDQYSPLGTLLDVANMYKMTSHCHEEVALSVTVALLRMVVTMHRCGIIHGDIKPDNILLFESKSSEEINVKLIDFGRGIDMNLFPAGTMFTVNCHTDGFECIEMKTGQPWTVQVDTYGLLGVLYCLMHGEYMKVYHKNGARWTQNKSFKRHWNVKLWTKLFDLLLNSPNASETVKHCEELLDEFEQALLCSPPAQRLEQLEFEMKTRKH